MAVAAESGTRIEKPWDGALCYLFGILFPLAYLFCVPRRKQRSFLRFHSIQCLMLFALICLLDWGQHFSKIAAIAELALLISWLVAMIQAGHGKRFKLPILGQAAEFISVKTEPSVQ